MTGLNDAIYAATATALHDLAAKAIAAKASGDYVTLASTMVKYRQLFGKLDPIQQTATKQALASETPSGFMVALLNFSDTAIGVLKIVTVVVVGYVLLSLIKTKREGTGV